VKYNHHKLDVDTYINSLYLDGLQKSSKLSDSEIKIIVLNIGIFKTKGYVKAFRNKLADYTIDDLLELYAIDRNVSLNLLQLTSQIEIKLKSLLTKVVYSLTENPFFYLLKNNYKEDFILANDSLYDWEVKNNNRISRKEIYPHYRDYYLANYNFEENRKEYIGNNHTIKLNDRKDINYPPFHYFIESATLGTLINIISKLKINNNDILKLVANEFSIYNPNVFLNYLLRLKEVRNRCAHNGRILNRNYRGLKAIGKHKDFRKIIYEHKLIDVYFTLHFLLDNTKQFNSIGNLLNAFKDDIFPECSDKIKDFIISIMKTR
jgi:abortive infection bacteriophage resistance protein